MMEHLSVCEYRPIDCFAKFGTNCGGKICDLSELSDHLITDHECHTETEISRSPGCYEWSTSMDHLNNSALQLRPVVIVKFDDKSFLVHWAFYEDSVYWWSTVVGGEREAKGYKYNMKLFSNSDSNGASENNFAYTLPVFPLRENANFMNVMESGQFASIHWKSLATVCTERVCSDVKKYKYSWTTEIVFAKRVQSLKT